MYLLAALLKIKFKWRWLCLVFVANCFADWYLLGMKSWKFYSSVSLVESSWVRMRICKNLRYYTKRNKRALERTVLEHSRPSTRVWALEKFVLKKRQWIRISTFERTWNIANLVCHPKAIPSSVTELTPLNDSVCWRITQIFKTKRVFRLRVYDFDFREIQIHSMLIQALNNVRS